MVVLMNPDRWYPLHERAMRNARRRYQEQRHKEQAEAIDNAITDRLHREQQQHRRHDREQPVEVMA